MDRERCGAVVESNPGVDRRPIEAGAGAAARCRDRWRCRTAGSCQRGRRSRAAATPARETADSDWDARLGWVTPDAKIRRAGGRAALSHGGLPITASNPAIGAGCPAASKKTSGNASSQWNAACSPRCRGRDRATPAAAFEGRVVEAPVAAAIHSCTTPAEGGVPGHNAAAHHTSAAADHRASGPSRDASADSARSLSLTIVDRVRRLGKANRSGRTRAATSSRPDRRTAAALAASRRPRWHGWPRQVAEARANQAVAGGEMVIEKGQRPIGGERRQPQRQPRELHRRRVEIDTVQAALARPGGAATRDPAARHLGAGHWPVANQRCSQRVREKPARGDEKRAAAHRRIDTRSARISSAVRPSTSGASVRRTRNSVIERGV